MRACLATGSVKVLNLSSLNPVNRVRRHASSLDLGQGIDSKVAQASRRNWRIHAGSFRLADKAATPSALKAATASIISSRSFTITLTLFVSIYGTVFITRRQG